MVISYVQNTSLFVLLMITNCIPWAMTTALMFNLAEIGPHNHNKDILTDGPGTYISPEGIQLTSPAPTRTRSASPSRAGRATYAKLLHLWDTATGQLADFTTNFSFVMDSDGAMEYGDGLTFFLAENNSVVTVGGAMGLPVMVDASSMTTASTSPFVAVEFDTYWNPNWDPVDARDVPIGHHVGININSLISVEAKKWWSNITYGRECVVKIKYDSLSQNLNVIFTGFQNDTIVPDQFELHYTVDLRSELPEWVLFGFTASTSGDHFQKNSIKSWFFNSSDLHVDQNRWRKDSKKKWMIVGIAVYALVIICASLAFIFCIFSRKKRSNDQASYSLTFEPYTHPRAFSFDELSQATNNFHEENKLGRGGFGAVYRAVLSDGIRVAVKRLSNISQQGVKEYEAEVKIISKSRHRHLVQLIGWCHERAGEFLVVYELMENKSLDFHLFNSENSLSWEVRYKIAQELAKAVRYLHEECTQCVVHRDIKPSNVMLDSSFSAKLGDFGLGKLIDHDKLLETTTIAGTVGYVAPEYVLKGEVSQKSDDYSFGVVALEIATGRKSIDPNAQGNQKILVDWVRNLYEMDRVLDAADPKLGEDYRKEQMKALIVLGLWCVHPDPTQRLSVREVVRALNNTEAPLSDLFHRIPNLAHGSATPCLSFDLILETSHRSPASVVPFEMVLPDAIQEEVSVPNVPATTLLASSNTVSAACFVGSI